MLGVLPPSMSGSFHQWGAPKQAPIDYGPSYVKSTIWNPLWIPAVTLHNCARKFPQHPSARGCRLKGCGGKHVHEQHLYSLHHPSLVGLGTTAQLLSKLSLLGTALSWTPQLPITQSAPVASTRRPCGFYDGFTFQLRTLPGPAKPWKVREGRGSNNQHHERN